MELLPFTRDDGTIVLITMTTTTTSNYTPMVHSSSAQGLIKGLTVSSPEPTPWSRAAFSSIILNVKASMENPIPR